MFASPVDNNNNGLTLMHLWTTTLRYCPLLKYPMKRYTLNISFCGAAVGDHQHTPPKGTSQAFISLASRGASSRTNDSTQTPRLCVILCMSGLTSHNQMCSIVVTRVRARCEMHAAEVGARYIEKGSEGGAIIVEGLLWMDRPKSKFE